MSEAAKKNTLDQRMEAYDKVVMSLQDDFYALVHDVALRDTGAFKQTLQWYIYCISFNVVSFINRVCLQVH